MRLHKWDRCIDNFGDLLMLARERLGDEEVELLIFLAWLILFGTSEINWFVRVVLRTR